MSPGKPGRFVVALVLADVVVIEPIFDVAESAEGAGERMVGGIKDPPAVGTLDDFRLLLPISFTITAHGSVPRGFQQGGPILGQQF